MDFAGKRVTVAGLGRFGGNIAAARWLMEQGAKVTVTDRDPPEKLEESVAQLAELPIDFRLGAHLESDFTDTELVVASPAIPLHNPFLESARKAGVPVTTEIRLFAERCPAKIVAVTGTKGKSTTTAMLAAMLQQGTSTVWTGGNIGGSPLFDLPDLRRDDPVLAEPSTYKLQHLLAL